MGPTVGRSLLIRPSPRVEGPWEASPARAFFLQMEPLNSRGSPGVQWLGQMHPAGYGYGYDRGPSFPLGSRITLSPPPLCWHTFPSPGMMAIWR